MSVTCHIRSNFNAETFQPRPSSFDKISPLLHSLSWSTCRVESPQTVLQCSDSPTTFNRVCQSPALLTTFPAASFNQRAHFLHQPKKLFHPLTKLAKPNLQVKGQPISRVIGAMHALDLPFNRSYLTTLRPLHTDKVSTVRKDPEASTDWISTAIDGL